MNVRIPIGDWAEAVVRFLLDYAQGLFDGIDYAVEAVVDSIEALLLLPGALPLAAILALVALWRVGWRFGLFAVAALGLIFGMGLWDETVSTLALVLAATLLSLVIGVPLGIWAAKSDFAQAATRPVLDFMQTMPAFVYLIPAAMFFGLGQVPGAIATIIFSMPPAVRLTNLGIRQVPKELIEAGLAFGCTGRQLLFKVQIPNALPTIMAGVNQTIMLALSMVVIASMIGAGGLGNEVLRGIQRLDIGLGFEGGLGVVILAILLDRISQSFGQRQPESLVARLRRAFARTPTKREAEASETARAADAAPSEPETSKAG